MRVPRTLAVVAVTISLLAIPALSQAQSETSAAVAPYPLARQPDGRLPLEGTPWRLVAYRWNEVERTPGPEVAAAMTLSAGKLEASGGCTSFRGTYGTTGGAIGFVLKRLKQNDCAEQTTMVQLAMVEGLKDAARYQVDESTDGSQLALLDDTGVELLRFGLDDVAGSLISAEWELVSYTVEGMRHEPDPSSTPRLIFMPEKRNAARRRASGRVLSSTGCNGFAGDFYLHANVMSFSELSVTDAPCTDPLMAQQDAILAVYDATSVQVAFPPDGLVLTAAESGDTLEYQAVPALEGVTWVRSPAPARGADEERVTIRLEGGEVSGVGPCGSYSASYLTDGVFITFSEVLGAEGDTCVRAKEERKLLAALRAAVRLDRDPGKLATVPRLTLRDARGKSLVRFEYPFSNAP